MLLVTRPPYKQVDQDDDGEDLLDAKFDTLHAALLGRKYSVAERAWLNGLVEAPEGDADDDAAEVALVGMRPLRRSVLIALLRPPLVLQALIRLLY